MYALVNVQTVMSVEFKDENGIPLQPQPSYPIVEVFDYNDNLVLRDTASATSEPGEYYISMIIPPTAPVSTKMEHQYKALWTFIDTNGNTFKKEQYFYVYRDVILRDTSFFGIIGQKVGIAILIDMIPVTDINWYIYKGSQVVLQGTIDRTRYIYVNGNFYYSEDIESTQLGVNSDTEFLVSFQYKKTPNSLYETMNDNLYLVSPQILPYINKLKEYIDKINKELDTNLGYETYQLYLYLMEGMKLLNAYPPLSNYEYRSLPPELGIYWMYCSEIIALNAQYLAVGETAFDWSGQSISLNVDMTGTLDSKISRLTDMVNENLPKAKRELKRRSQAGIVMTDNNYGNSFTVVGRPVQGGIGRVTYGI